MVSSLARRFLGFLASRSCLWVVLASAFLLRLLWLFYAEPVPVSDFEDYRALAEGLLQHGQLGYPEPSAGRLPVYPAFLALLMVLSESVIWLSFVNVLLSTLLVSIVYLLALRTTSRKELANGAALLCGLNPTFIFFAPLLASEHLFAILFFGSLLLLSTETRTSFSSRVWVAVGGGVLSAAALLTRGEGLLYLPVVVLAALLAPGSTKQRVAVTAVLVLVCLSLTSTWYFRNYEQVGPGAGLSTYGGLNFYFAHNPSGYGWHPLEGTELGGLGEVETQELGYRRGLQYLRDSGAGVLLKDIARGTERLYFSLGDYAVLWSTRLPKEAGDSTWRLKNLRGARYFAYSTAGYYLIMLCAALSVALFRKYAWRLWLVTLGTIAMNWVCFAVVFWGKARYRYISEVAFCILASVLVYEVLRRLSPSPAAAPIGVGSMPRRHSSG